MRRRYGREAKAAGKGWPVQFLSRQRHQPWIGWGFFKEIEEQREKGEQSLHVHGFVEHHLAGKKRAQSIKNLKKRGWAGATAPAIPTLNGGKQGHGGAPLQRRSGLLSWPTTRSQKRPRQRPEHATLLTQWTGQVVRGADVFFIVACSVVGMGPADCNVTMMDEIASLVRIHDKPLNEIEPAH